MCETLLEEIKEILKDNKEIVYSERNGCKNDNNKIQCNCTKKGYKEANILIYLNTEREIAIVWDLKRQRNKAKKYIGRQSLEKNWNDNILPVEDEIECYYKKVADTKVYQKVLVMSFNTLFENIKELYQLLELDKNDKNCPDDADAEEQPRTKHTAESWNRDARFRRMILKRYGSKCAICRCSEEKILEAAHIKAVAKGGREKKENGICLCRNHHKMFDSGLIKIDLEKLELYDISKTVESMAWYDEFNKKYNKKILPPLK